MRRLLPLLFALAALLLAPGGPLRAQTAASLPAGEGRDLVATACSQCHALSIIAAMRNGAPGWKRHVYNMVLRGAQLTPGEADTVIRYLTDNFGPAPAANANAAAVALPAGPGKELTESRCGVCHDLQRIVAVKREKRDWDGIVAGMYERFGTSAPDEAQTIAAYLAAQFGRD